MCISFHLLKSTMDIFSTFSPTDYRYAVEELKEYLSEEAFVRYKAKVEAAIARAFEKRGILRKDLCDAIIEACEEIRADEVYDEEKRTKHDIRALVNVIRR
ncbi:MAG: adenylosuccinate lyase, partial [Candidatus Methanospirareceae archaeon]